MNSRVPELYSYGRAPRRFPQSGPTFALIGALGVPEKDPKTQRCNPRGISLKPLTDTRPRDHKRHEAATLPIPGVTTGLEKPFIVWVTVGLLWTCWGAIEY